MASEGRAKRMRCVVLDRYGGVDELRVDSNTPLPEMQRGCVRVRVHAASVNPCDWQVAAGNLSFLAKKPPLVLGLDFAGVIESVGKGCGRQELKAGVRVFGATNVRRMGCMADYVVVPEKFIATMPTNASFVVAASLPRSALAAYQALNWARVGSGQKALVLGASGGVGTMLVQIAKHGLALSSVAATASTGEHARLRSLGVDVIIDPAKQNWWEALRGEDFDVLVDTRGGVNEDWKHAALVLKKKGCFVSTAGDHAGPLNKKGIVSAGLSIVNRKFWSIFGYLAYHYVSTTPRFDHLNLIRNQVESRQIEPVVDKAFPIDRVHHAFAYAMAGIAVGKVVLTFVEGEEEIASSHRPPSIAMEPQSPRRASVQEPTEVVEKKEEEAAPVVQERVEGKEEQEQEFVEEFLEQSQDIFGTVGTGSAVWDL